MMQKHVLARRLATRDEVQAARPPTNAHTIEWCKYYGQLRAWVWVQDDHPVGTELAEEEMLAALREEPVEVPLLSGELVYVYPKGIDCLLWFRQQDWLLGWLTSRVEAIHLALADDELDREQIPQPVTTLERAAIEMGMRVAAIAAVACSQGPQLDRELATNPPARFHDLSPIDLYNINRAFAEVNAGRLAQLAQLVRTPGDGETMGWNVFLGTLSMRLKTDPAKLATDRSLVSLLAQVRLSAKLSADVEETFGS